MADSEMTEREKEVLGKCEAQIEVTQEGIQKNQDEITSVEEKLQKETSESVKSYLRIKKHQLRDEQCKLRDKELKMMDEKHQLRIDHRLLRGPPHKKSKLEENDSHERDCSMQISEKIYSALINAGVDNSILKFGCTKHLSFLPPELLIRESYVKLHDRIHEDPNTSALILGNPGIGKSYFSFYELFRLLRDLVDKKSNGIIVYESAPHRFFCVLNADGVVDAGPIREEGTPRRDATYYLFDAGTNGEYTPKLPDCQAIVFSSPDESNYISFLKHRRQPLKKFYMPVWSLEELKLLVPISKTVTVVNVDERFELFGGIPRYVLDPVYSEKDVDHAIRAVNDQTVFQVIGQSDIFHLIIDTTFEHYEVRFASQRVAKKYFEMLEKRLVLYIPVNVLILWRRDSSMRSARGVLFEMWAHKKLVKGGDFTVRCLESGTITQLHLPPMRSASFSNLQELSEIHSYNDIKYLQPTQTRHGNFVAVDSFAGDKLFQMTVAKQHTLRVDGLNKSLQAIGSPPFPGHFSLYFVVPDDIFDDDDAFRQKQNYLNEEKATNPPPLVQSIKQYALCLPLRKHVPKGM